MHESIRKSAGYLTLRQRIERLGIEDREDRIIAVESIFFLGLVARNDRPGVHLGTRGRHGEDRSQRHGLAGLPLEHDVPCIAVVEKARSDEFRTVDDRPAADSQQEVHLPLFAQRNGFAQGLDRRIRLDAPELDQIAAFECGDDLIVDAVTLDASAAEGQHDAFSGGNELRQTGDLALAENQFGRIVIDEVVHGECLFILLRRQRMTGRLRNRIAPGLTGPPAAKRAVTPLKIRKKPDCAENSPLIFNLCGESCRFVLKRSRARMGVPEYVPFAPCGSKCKDAP